MMKGLALLQLAHGIGRYITIYSSSFNYDGYDPNKVSQPQRSSAADFVHQGASEGTRNDISNIHNCYIESDVITVQFKVCIVLGQ